MSTLAFAGTPPMSASAGEPLEPELRLVRWSETLPDGTPVSLANGDTLRLETHWNRGGLTILADVSSLDAGASPVPLVAAAETDSVYTLEFASGNYAFDGAKTVPLTVTAPDLTGERNFDDLVACVANLPPQLLSVRTLPPRTVYRPNDLLRIETQWNAPFGVAEVWADLRAIEAEAEPVVADSIGAGRYLLTYRIPSFPAEVEGPQRIPLVCRNLLCGATVDRSLSITLERDGTSPPVLIDWEILAPLDFTGTPRPVQNGDTIRLRTRWDREGLHVAADAYELAPTDTTRPAVFPIGPGEFEIVYTVPTDNVRSDAADLPFRLVAEDASGASTIDASIRFCLSNRQPRHLESRLLLPREVYRGGDTLFVESRWVSGNRLPLTLEMDVERVEPNASRPVAGELTEVFGDTLYAFEFAYRIPPLRDNRGPDGVGLLLPLSCQETGGCGLRRFEDLRFSLDTTAPDTGAPVLEPLPSETTADSVFVRGRTVVEAARVALSRQNVFFSYVPVDPGSGAFSGWVRLLADEENAIRAWAEDELGNRTRSSDPLLVRQVSTFEIAFDTPFTRGGTLRIADPGGVWDIRLGIYDLEGRLVREWREPGPLLDRSWVWDGDDADGDAVRQGYYLLRAAWRESDGTGQERTVGLVLGD